MFIKKQHSLTKRVHSSISDYIGFYKFDNNLLDESDYERHVIAPNIDAVYLENEGRIGLRGSATGTLYIPSVDKYDNLHHAPFTIAAWIYWIGNGNVRFVETSGYKIYGYPYWGNINIRIYKDGVNYQYTIQKGNSFHLKWHHIIIKWDGTNISLKIDNELQTPDTETLGSGDLINDSSSNLQLLTYTNICYTTDNLFLFNRFTTDNEDTLIYQHV